MKPGRYALLFFCMVALVAGSGQRVSALIPPHGKAMHLTRAKILHAIAQAAHYIKGKYKPGSYWEITGPGGWASGGCTALATYALLQAGMATGDARLGPDATFIHRALEYLVKLHPRGTYVAGLQLAALTSEPMSIRGYHRAIHRAADFLFESEHKNGAYDYYWNGKKPHEAVPARWDNSNTQYGVLGVWCAEAGGYLYPPISYWRMAEKHWRSCQNPDGGWCYQRRGASTRSMTAAGLATLYIVDQYLHPNLLDVHRPSSALERGLSWLAKHIRTKGNLYYLYGLERVGLASGLRFIGGHNWYRMGARIILKAQEKPGEWNSGVTGASSNVIPTAYALLFLSRGLNPVIFNKLSYPGYWNLRPHDDQNATAWIGSTLEESLNWSVADIHANPHHWLNAPILMITGDKAVNFNARQIARLRWYVQHGGMIFSIAEDDSRAFDQSMVQTADQLFPGRSMVPLPASSPIFNIQYPINARQFPLAGLSNGERLLWVHSPVDLSAAWQTMATVTEGADFQLAENIDLYATGEKKPTTHLNFSHPWRAKKPAYELNAAFMHLAGKPAGGNPPNGADVHALTRFALRHGVRLDCVLHRYADFPSPARYPVAYVIVRRHGGLTAQSRHAIAHYIRQGGRMIVENYYGTPTEMKQLRSFLTREFPSHPLHRLKRSVLLTSEPPAIPIKRVKYNSYYDRYHRPSGRLPLFEMSFHHRTAVIVVAVNASSQWIRNNYWGTNAMATSSARRVALDLLIKLARESKNGLRTIAPPENLALKKRQPARMAPIAAPPPPPEPVVPLPPTINLQ